jgi:hypothetical protein
MPRSSKHRRLTEGCREAWNRFDPIGIRRFAASHLDEYDSYLSHTVHLLLSNADAVKIADYVRQVVRVSMGLSGFPEGEIIAFARELREIMGRAD